ncbi:MAG: copper homeostasis membrane protein CopD [Rhizomicrobium sp.]
MLETAVIVFRFVQYMGAMILFGSSLFFLFTIPQSERIAGASWMRPLLASGAAAVLVATLLGLVAQTGVLAGALAEAINPATFKVALTEMSFGRAGVIRIIVSGLTLTAILILRPGRVLGFISAVGGFVVCVSMAWMGHGAATKGAAGLVHLIADIFHLLAVAGWIGALVAFSLMLVQRHSTVAAMGTLARALQRFAGIGAGFVAVILATGLINSYFLVGLEHLQGLWTTRYGELLSLKIILFIAMLAFAARNRLLLAPALEHALNSGEPSRSALASLRRSILSEAAVAVFVLGLVAWLGTLAPVSNL